MPAVATATPSPEPPNAVNTVLHKVFPAQEGMNHLGWFNQSPGLVSVPQTAVTTIPSTGVMIIPVMPRGPEKAFGDASVLLAQRLFVHLQDQYPQWDVHAPGNDLQRLTRKGILPFYRRLTEQYARNGTVEVSALKTLADKLTMNPDRPVQLVVFVMTDVYTARPTQPKSVRDKLGAFFLDDQVSLTWRYTAKSHVAVFAVPQPGMPYNYTDINRLWEWQWASDFPVASVGNVTASVFQDVDSMQALRNTTNRMSTFLLAGMPNPTQAQWVNAGGEDPNSISTKVRATVKQK